MNSLVLWILLIQCQVWCKYHSPKQSKQFTCFIKKSPILENGALNPTIEEIFSVLENRAEKSVGLFRVPGNVSKVNKIVKRIEKGKPVKWEDVDTNTITGVFKKIVWTCGFPIADLPDALIACTENDFDRLSKEYYHNLPEESKFWLDRILLFFNSLIKYSTVNQMNPVNYAKIVTPNIFNILKYDLIDQMINVVARWISTYPSLKDPLVKPVVNRRKAIRSRTFSFDSLRHKITERRNKSIQH